MSIKENIVAIAITYSSLLSMFSNDMTMPVIGAPVTVIGAAFIGATIGFFVGDPAKSTRELFMMTILGTIVGSVVAALFPYVGFEWAHKVQGPIAIVAAMGTRHLLPPIIERCKELIKSFNPFNFFKKKEDSK